MKTELLSLLRDKTGLPKKDIDAVITAFASTLKEEVLDSGKELQMRNFGTFKLRSSVARTGRNPRTGDAIQIPASKAVSFTSSPALRLKDNV